MPYIHFEKIWEDDDEMIQLLISLSNDSFRSSQDIYVYPEELISFGQKLQGFPKDLDHKVVLEYGSKDKNVLYHFILRAYLYNRLGHAALEVQTDNHRDPPERASSNFFIPVEAAVLNRFGRLLCNWTEGDMSEPPKYEW